VLLIAVNQTERPRRVIRTTALGKSGVRMDGVRRVVYGLLGGTLAILFAVLVGCVSWQVGSRYLFEAPSTMTEEITRLLLVWLAMLGAAYTLGQRRHLAINLIGAGVPAQRLRPLNLLLVALIAAFAGGRDGLRRVAAGLRHHGDPVRSRRRCGCLRACSTSACRSRAS
jgi:hypothetical protein